MGSVYENTVKRAENVGNWTVCQVIPQGFSLGSNCNTILRQRCDDFVVNCIESERTFSQDDPDAARTDAMGRRMIP